jgi:hypothetical protein
MPLLVFERIRIGFSLCKVNSVDKAECLDLRR